MRAHAKSSQVFASFLSKLIDDKNTNAYFKQIFDVANKVRSTDILKTVSKTLIKAADSKHSQWAISNISRINPHKSGYFIVTQLYNFAKKHQIEAGLLNEVISQLFEFSISQDNKEISEFARQKLINALGQLNLENLEFVYGLIKSQKNETHTTLLKFLSNIKKLNIAETEADGLGKRKSRNSNLITQTQLETLKKLFLIIGLEDYYTKDFSNLEHLTELLGALIANKPIKKDTQSPLDKLSELFYTQHIKQVSYTKGLIKNSFKYFINEISNIFVDKLCQILQNKIKVYENKPKEEKKVVESLEELKEKDINVQGNLIRNDVSMKICDLLEILIQNSTDNKILLTVYKTLIKSFKSAFKRKKKTGLVQRYHYLLEEISKTTIKIDKSDSSELSEIFSSVVKAIMREKNLNKFLSKIVFHMVKIVDAANHHDATQMVNDTVSNYMTAKNPKMSLDVLTGIVLSLSYDKYIFNLLLKQVRTGNSVKSRLEALEILKKLIKIGSITPKESKKLIRSARHVTKESLKNKEKSKLLKNILAALFIYSKHTTDVTQFYVDFSKLKIRLQNNNGLFGILAQIEKASPNK